MAYFSTFAFLDVEVDAFRVQSGAPSGAVYPLKPKPADVRRSLPRNIEMGVVISVLN
jgi:hypothetical protein